MNTIRKIIDRVGRIKPHAFSAETILSWIAELDGKIALDVMLMDGSELENLNYAYPDALDMEPLVRFPHDSIYDKWLIAQIDAACEEWDRYANDIEVYNAYFKNYVRWFASTYRPAQGGMERCGTYPRYFLTAYGLAVMQGFHGTLEEWLLSLHGEPGRTPVMGEDYFTETDKMDMLSWIREKLPNQTLEIDGTLTKAGYAADAKKTGDAIADRALASRLINGKPLTEDVKLNAADVGARPSNWMPSAEDVGARPSNWLPNAADVGAAPANHTEKKNNPHGVTAVQVGAEQKKLKFNKVSVAAAAFVADETYEEYPFRASVTLAGVLVTDIPEVIFGLADAIGGNFAPVAESYEGGIYIYAADTPSEAVEIPTIICWKGDA